MPDPATLPEIAVWTQGRRAPLIHRILSIMGDSVHPIAVAGPDADAPTSNLARSLNCPLVNDPRKLLIDHPAAFLLLAAPLSPAHVRLAHEQRATLLTLDPIPDDLDAAPAGVTLVPAFDASPGWIAAADPKEVLGPPSSISFTALSPPTDAPLFSLLVDAWRTVLQLTDLPDAVHASLSGSADPNPRDITGHLTVHAALSDGRGVVFQLSDRAPLFQRSLLAVSDAGQLHVTDFTYHLHDAHGKLIDSTPDKPRTNPPPPDTCAHLIAHHWQQCITHPALASLSVDNAARNSADNRPLACALASLLSSRTTQPESPANLLALHGIAMG